MVAIAGSFALLAGCNRARDDDFAALPTRVVVVAPVLNLSGTSEIDMMQLTDTLASELMACPNTSVIPVNLTLAALARQGKRRVEEPDEALELARELGADATVVAAVTEYDPYDPPTLGLVMQWYGLGHRPGASTFDPISASRSATWTPELAASSGPVTTPEIQVQRVFSAADQAVLDEVRKFARDRSGHQSPYGWRKWIKAQELYVRYCMWSLIRTMLPLTRPEPAGEKPVEATS